MAYGTASPCSWRRAGVWASGQVAGTRLGHWRERQEACCRGIGQTSRAAGGRVAPSGNVAWGSGVRCAGLPAALQRAMRQPTAAQPPAAGPSLHSGRCRGGDGEVRSGQEGTRQVPLAATAGREARACPGSSQPWWPVGLLACVGGWRCAQLPPSPANSTAGSSALAGHCKLLLTRPAAAGVPRAGGGRGTGTCGDWAGPQQPDELCPRLGRGAGAASSLLLSAPRWEGIRIVGAVGAAAAQGACAALGPTSSCREGGQAAACRRAAQARHRHHGLVRLAKGCATMSSSQLPSWQHASTRGRGRGDTRAARATLAGGAAACPRRPHTLPWPG